MKSKTLIELLTKRHKVLPYKEAHQDNPSDLAELPYT
jgi:hypothetical protein